MRGIVVVGAVLVLLLPAFAGCLDDVAVDPGVNTGDRKIVNTAGAVGLLFRIPFHVHAVSDITDKGSYEQEDWRIWGTIDPSSAPDPTVIYRNNFDEMVGNRVGKMKFYVVNGRPVQTTRAHYGTAVYDIDLDPMGRAESVPKPIVDGAEIIMDGVGSDMNTILPFMIKVRQSGLVSNSITDQAFSIIFFVRFQVPEMYEEKRYDFSGHVDLYVPLKEFPDVSNLDVQGYGYDGSAQAKWTKMRVVTKTWLDLSWLTRIFGIEDGRFVSSKKVNVPEIIKWPEWSTPVRGHRDDQSRTYLYRLIG